MPMTVEEIEALRRPRGIPFAINKIGHVVLSVSDVGRSVKFYTEVLGCSISDVYPDALVPGKMAFLRFNGDHHGIGVIAAKGADGKQGRELHHIALEILSLDELVLAREYFKKIGVPIVREGRRRAGSQISVEIADPDGHSIELFWGMDQVGTEGVVRPSSEWKQNETLEEAIADVPPGQDTTLRYVKLPATAAR
jgi:catechol 2,3-dioxygenase-like lactoylglutathione lyase family enzyme